MAMWRTVWMGVVAAGLVAPVFARAQSMVDVQLGPAVQARTAELGPGELDAERRYLQQAVQHSLTRGGQGALQVRLEIVDIQPNRPTSAQLGSSAGLSDTGSIGLGGAAVTGEIIGSDGVRRPLRYRFFPRTLAEETNFTTWGDADEAFDEIAHDVAAGHPPDDDRTWPPPRQPSAPTGTRLPG